MHGKLLICLFVALFSVASAETVVFMGASIIERWDLSNYFPGKDYINKGISGQTSYQVRDRLQDDAINLNPDIILFQVGSNDIANGESQDDIINSIQGLGQAVRDAGIKVIMSSLLPTRDEMSESRPNWEIDNINGALRQFCSDQGIYYIDFNSAMKGDDGQMRPELTVDGLHPSDEGYWVMVPMVNDAIQQVLSW